MTKKNIMVDDCHASNITQSNTLGEVLAEVTRLISKFGEGTVIDFDSGYNNICETITYERLETDVEYVKRLKLEEKQDRESVERREKKELSSKLKDKLKC